MSEEYSTGQEALEHLKDFLACLTDKVSGPNQPVHVPMLMLHSQYTTSLHSPKTLDSEPTDSTMAHLGAPAQA